MSRENVELVRSLYPSPEVDLVGLFRDEAAWSAFAASLAPFVGVDFCTVMHQFGSERRYAGLEGLRAFMLDWTSPWASYRVETEKGIDLGDRVLLLNNDRGRLEGSKQEVRGRIAAVWSLHEGKLARLDAYTSQADALEAVGLAE